MRRGRWGGVWPPAPPIWGRPHPVPLPEGEGTRLGRRRWGRRGVVARTGYALTLPSPRGRGALVGRRRRENGGTHPSIEGAPFRSGSQGPQALPRRGSQGRKLPRRGSAGPEPSTRKLPGRAGGHSSTPDWTPPQTASSARKKVPRRRALYRCAETRMRPSPPQTCDRRRSAAAASPAASSARKQTLPAALLGRLRGDDGAAARRGAPRSAARPERLRVALHVARLELLQRAPARCRARTGRAGSGCRPRAARRPAASGIASGSSRPPRCADAVPADGGRPQLADPAGAVGEEPDPVGGQQPLVAARHHEVAERRPATGTTPSAWVASTASQRPARARQLGAARQVEPLAGQVADLADQDQPGPPVDRGRQVVHREVVAAGAARRAARRPARASRAAG